jgi:hypothetical protein
MRLSGLLTLKDLVLLMIGGLIGYIANRIVAKQTEKKKDLVLQTVGR